MKKLLILILSVICILALVACGGNTNDTDTSKDSAVVDTSSDTDTSVDTGTDADTDTDTDTDGGNTEDTLIPWESTASAETIEKAEELLESKHRLEYNEDGSFRVIILADIHMNTNGNSASVAAVGERVKTLVDRVNPNLVIFTGDNTINSASEEQLKANIDAMAGYLEEKNIPWCHVYGNHDFENALPTAEQQVIYESYEYCISKDVGTITGVGNYVHAVYNPDGSIGSVIYLLDSGAYGPGGYSYVKEDQIEWYKQTSELLQEYNNGSVINGMMAFHIPMVENRTAYENRNNDEIVYEWNGQKNEDICSSSYDTTLLETMFERGDIKLVVTGHDHTNDYMFNYKGIKLSSSPNISDLTYGAKYVQGSRVIDLNAATVGTNIPTYVTYLVERPNPDDYNDYDTNISIEINKDMVDSAEKSNGTGGGVSGKLEITLVENKGVDGSEAIGISRGNSDGFDFALSITKGKLGDNKYLFLWADFTELDFSKATFGLLTEKGMAAPSTSKFLKSSAPFYYLADGETEWQELSYGENGCFGTESEDLESMHGKKGYFAFPIESLGYAEDSLTSDSLITAIYFCGNVEGKLSYRNKSFYIDEIMLVEDYTAILNENTQEG